MDIDSKNRRWPQPGEQWLIEKDNTPRNIVDKTRHYLLLSHNNDDRTLSGRHLEWGPLNLTTYVKPL